MHEILPEKIPQIVRQAHSASVSIRPVAAAITDAIFNATGVRISPNRVKRILAAATFLCGNGGDRHGRQHREVRDRRGWCNAERMDSDQDRQREPKWTIEQDQTAPSKLRIVKQSGRRLTCYFS